MRWFERSVVLGLLMVVLTPAPAHAWFEWLDYLSGPGPFKGWKVDVRVWCSGPATPFASLRQSLQNGSTEALVGRSAEAVESWEAVITGLERNDIGLGLVPESTFKELRTTLVGPLKMALENKTETASARVAQVTLFTQKVEALLNMEERASVSIASSGILLSLCPAEKRRAFAVEMGFTTLQADSNPAYALDRTIRLNTFTGGVSYRLPLPADRDLLDLGFNAGMYRFSSSGFAPFSGLTLEPFVDIHGPTELAADKGLRQLAGLVTLRLGVVWFPAGFDGAQFASAPSKPTRISGREGSASATVFFDLAPLLRRRP